MRPVKTPIALVVSLPMSSSVISKLDTAKFSIVRRGYDRVEVERFLRTILKDLTDAQSPGTVDRGSPRVTPRTSPSLTESRLDVIGSRTSSVPRVEETATRRLVATEQQAAHVLAQATQQADEVRRAAENALRQADEEAAQLRAEAREDAERLEAAAMDSVRQLIEFGKSGAREELERACAELDRATGAGPGPRLGEAEPEAAAADQGTPTPMTGSSR